MPSAFKTSHITIIAFFLNGSGTIKTGYNNKSEEFPGAYSVLEPSKHHYGASSTLPEKSFTTKVFPRRD